MILAIRWFLSVLDLMVPHLVLSLLCQVMHTVIGSDGWEKHERSGITDYTPKSSVQLLSSVRTERTILCTPSMTIFTRRTTESQYPYSLVFSE